MKTLTIGDGVVAVPCNKDGAWGAPRENTSARRAELQAARRENMPAVIIGALAVHRTLYAAGAGSEGEQWTVTHVPTGLAVTRRIASRQDALGAALELQIALPAEMWDTEDFVFLRQQSPEHLAAIRAVVEHAEREFADNDGGAPEL